MKIELVSKTTGVGKYQELSTEEIISAIARHGVIKEDNGKLVKYLMDNRHMSPLDMVNFTFEIQTSRAIGRQILRHASVKFQEHSQRYSDKVIFEPIEFRLEHATNRQSSTEIVGTLTMKEFSFSTDIFDNFEEHQDLLEEVGQYLKNGEKLYRKLLDKKFAKECARMILPETTQSTLSGNGTLRSWLSFLNVRMDAHAQKEAQEIALLIGEALELEMPNVFSNIDWRKGMFM